MGYIRPIMLVQVERTGKEQRDGQHIHADDVKEWLLQSGLNEAQVAIKTAEQNDLNQLENQDLLSPTNRVRVIVTKAALQEGWDCPFAYVLCSLAAASNLSAMTQLVGRILRQPYALKTGVSALDECYVVTHHAATQAVVEAIKTGLEKDGLADLVIEVPQGGAVPNPGTSRRIERRPAFKTLQIYLPKVLRQDGGALRELDYETDILAAIDWRGFSGALVAAKIPDNPRQAAAQLQRITLTDAGEDAYFKGEVVAAAAETLRFDASYAVRVISDLVPNPFVARSIVGQLVKALEARGFEVAVFHATGMGGRAFESLAAEGAFAAVLDFAPQEVANHLFGSAISAGPDRLSNAGRRGIPQMVAPGCCDLVDVVGWHDPPEGLRQRPSHAHNRLLSSYVLDAAERRRVARELAAKLAGATGETVLFLPLRGGNEWDREGAPLADAAGLAAFCDEMRDACPANVDLVELDCHINDDAFCEAVLRRFDEWLAKGVVAAPR